MSEPADRNYAGPREPDAPASWGLADRVRETIATGTERARSAAEQHASVAVSFRAMERNRGVAASVLAGGVAYRLLLWLLPFGLIVGGVLGLGDASDVQDAVATGGLPGAVVDAIGDVARAADSNSWWLLLTGVPLLLWEGYTGARALQLIHSLVWDEPPPRIRPLQSSLVFSGGMCVFVAAVSLTWWVRDWTQLEQLGVLVLMVGPLAGLWLAVSLRLPHGSAGWTELTARRLPRRDRLPGDPWPRRLPPGAEARDVDVALRRPRGGCDCALLHVGRRAHRRHRADPRQRPPRRGRRKTPR